MVNQYLLLLILGIPSVAASFRESQLYSKLLEEYEPLERPVANSSEPVRVKMGLILQQIVSVDEKNQLVDVNAWLKLSWHDYSLEWDPAKYDGVADLRFNADPQFDSTFQSNLLVYPDGMVNWMPPGIFRISCKIAVAWFPFDIQQCFMKFGSWTFDGSKLDLDVDDNGFDISETSAKRNIQHYECCVEPYYDVVFTFVIRRRVLYYAFNLILPCILITMLTLIGFTLPPDAGEKMSLQITIMLSICIFQNYVAEMSPPTSEALPFLGAFFAVCMFTCACCVVATTLALNFHHRNMYSHEMGDMFRCVMLNWLPWLLMMHRPGYKASRGKMGKDDSDDEEKEKQNICLESLLSKINPPITQEHIAQLLVLHEIYENLSGITTEFREKERNKDIEDDWKFAAMVVDRFCLFVFSFFIVFSTLALFLSVPASKAFR
ncbi:unnamed protein product [Nippostrongylus brasiliensis]|uniref:Neuronal acetylcholine receptor subunit alpha-7 (inferred by orthology to a C. elegans protein) n=1 Tax=Nippostrongylus brasiliensis TaxID=27835 RepID=A0A0N4XU48_NIPBR|nr:unnamed protein product [Nippostrongylus brasiliensis]